LRSTWAGTTARERGTGSLLSRSVADKYFVSPFHPPRATASVLLAATLARRQERNAGFGRHRKEEAIPGASTARARKGPARVAGRRLDLFQLFGVRENLKTPRGTLVSDEEALADERNVHAVEIYALAFAP